MILSPHELAQTLRPKPLPRGVWFACGAHLLVWIACILTLPLLLDEIGSWGMAQGDFSQVLEQTIYSQGQGPVYFVALSYWIKLLGDSTVSLRGLSLICSLLTIPLLALVARALKGDRYATTVAWLYACTPWVACFSHLARPYALANLLLVALLVSAVAFGGCQRKGSLLIAAALSGLLFLTQSLYVLALPFTVVLVWFSANSSNRIRAALLWLASLAIAQMVVVVGCLQIIRGHAGTLTRLAYLPNPALTDLVAQLLFGSALGAAALMVLSTGVALHASKPLLSLGSNRSFLIASAIAAVVPIGALWLASNLFSVSLFTARYFLLTAPFSALAAATLVQATASARLNLIGALLLGGIGFVDTGTRLFREAGFQAQLARDISSIDLKGCPLFASTGFIDLQIPERIEDHRMYSFLSAPVTYYKKMDIQLMPNSLDQGPARQYFDEKVLPTLMSSPCALVVAYNLGFSAAGAVQTPYASQLKVQLEQAGFSVSAHASPGSHPNAFAVMKAEKTIASSK